MSDGQRRASKPIQVTSCPKRGARTAANCASSRVPENEKRRSGEQKAYHSRFAETANVLNKLPKSQQSKAKRALQEIWMAETKKDALAAFDAFIETSFATVRHRTVRSKGCLSNKTALAMIFKLAEAAEKSWRRLDGHNQLPKIILGVRFTDGIEVVKPQAQAAAA
jgi:hypothetical protein